MSKYKLNVKEGVYYSNNLIHLIFLVLSHRFWHFRKHGKWID